MEKWSIGVLFDIAGRNPSLRHSTTPSLRSFPSFSSSLPTPSYSFPRMLPAKPWRTDAILRLGASVVICIFLGALIEPVVRCFRGVRPEHPLLFLLAASLGFGAFLAALLLLRRPWALENFIRYFGGTLVCAYAGFFLSWCAARLLPETPEGQGATVRLLVAVLSLQGAALVLIFSFVREHKVGWNDAFGFKQNVLLSLLFGIAVAWVTYRLLPQIQPVIEELVKSLGWDSPEQVAVTTMREVNDPRRRVLFGLATIFMVPLSEELLFRGILYPAIKQSGYPQVALWGTSLFFATIHFNLNAFLPLTLLALALVWLYERTQNLLAPIVAHALFNAMNFAHLYQSP